MNQNPEQIARDNIDKQLNVCGWKIQSMKEINLHAGIGVAVKEYPTDVGLPYQCPSYIEEESFEV